jgi:hypothetical protein
VQVVSSGEECKHCISRGQCWWTHARGWSAFPKEIRSHWGIEICIAQDQSPQTMETFGSGLVMVRIRLSNSSLGRGPAPLKLISCTLLQNIPTQDRLEGMAAFREKRPPKFVGKWLPFILAPKSQSYNRTALLTSGLQFLHKDNNGFQVTGRGAWCQGAGHYHYHLFYSSLQLANPLVHICFGKCLALPTWMIKL